MSLSVIVFLPVCLVISNALRARISPTSSRICARRSAPLSLTRPAPAFLMSRSIGATGMIRSFLDRGKTFFTPLTAIRNLLTPFSRPYFFKNFVLPERVSPMCEDSISGFLSGFRRIGAIIGGLAICPRVGP
jgi:hypothetical protein